MAIYTWDKDIINKTLTDEQKKNSLFRELDNQYDPNNTELFNRQDTFQQFKRRFRHDFVHLAKLDEDMLEYLLFLYEKVNLDDLMYVHFPETNITDEELVQKVKEFYDSLGDKEISEEIKTITDPDSHILRIARKDYSNIETSKILQGRIVVEPNNKNIYGSLYRKGTDEDIVKLSHEVAHLLTHRLFYDKKNPIMNTFLTEVDSYYMELLAGQYIGSTYHLENEALSFRANRLTRIIEQAWDMHIQYIMNTYLLNVNYKTLDKQAKADGYNHTITKEDYESYIRIPFIYKAIIINSYLVALELFRMTLDDKEKGLSAYKGLFTSDIKDYKRLLNKYGVNYLLNESSLNYMIDESKQLKKIFMSQ